MNGFAFHAPGPQFLEMRREAGFFFLKGLEARWCEKPAAHEAAQEEEM